MLEENTETRNWLRKNRKEFDNLKKEISNTVSSITFQKKMGKIITEKTIDCILNSSLAIDKKIKQPKVIIKSETQNKISFTISIEPNIINESQNIFIDCSVTNNGESFDD